MPSASAGRISLRACRTSSRAIGRKRARWPSKARQLAERAAGTSQHQPGFAAHALHLLGDLAFQSDRFDPENSTSHYREALALAQKRGMRPLIAHCHLGLGKVYCRIGTPEAHKNLATAATMYREMDMGFWLKQAKSCEDNFCRGGSEVASRPG